MFDDITAVQWWIIGKYRLNFLSCGWIWGGGFPTQKWQGNFQICRFSGLATLDSHSFIQHYMLSTHYVSETRCWGHCGEQQWQIPSLVAFTGSQGFRRTQKSVFLQDSYVILHMKTTDLGAKLLLNPSQFTHTERLIQTKLEFKRKLIPITPQKTQSIFYINWNS